MVLHFLEQLNFELAQGFLQLLSSVYLFIVDWLDSNYFLVSSAAHFE